MAAPDRRKFSDCLADGGWQQKMHLRGNDGIVCLSACKGRTARRASPDALLADALGNEWSAAKL